MKISCDVIKDLLPLYYEDVCYEASKKLVEEHLNECVTCSAFMNEMKENKLDEKIKMEREYVIGNHAKNVKRQSLIQALSIAMVISIIPPFVVNLATAGTLNWFFFVLTGVMLFGSITMVPLIVSKNKALWTLISSTLSLLLLLFAIDFFTSGRSWFWIAGGSTVFTVVSILFIMIFFKKSG